MYSRCQQRIRLRSYSESRRHVTVLLVSRLLIKPLCRIWKPAATMAAGMYTSSHVDEAGEQTNFLQLAHENNKVP